MYSRNHPTTACPASWYATISRSSGLISLFLRSSPAMTFSIESWKSIISTDFFPRRAAIKAASLHKFASSAPAKPGVWDASTRKSIALDSFNFFTCTFSTSTRPFKSGLSIRICRSNRPGRNSAESRISGRFVAAIKITPLSELKPSISLNN